MYSKPIFATLILCVTLFAPLSAQENNFLTFNLLGKTIDEVAAIEGDYEGHKVYGLLITPEEFIKLLKDVRSEGDYRLMHEKYSYISGINYGINRKFGDYSVETSYSFTDSGICIMCHYNIQILPKGLDINEYRAILDSVYDHLMEIYGVSRLKLLERARLNYRIKLDTNTLLLWLNISTRGDVEIEVSYFITSYY